MELREYSGVQDLKEGAYHILEPKGKIYPGVWEECHEVVQREVLHKAIGQVAGSKKDITRKHVESVRNLYFSQVGRYVELPYQVLAERNYHGILLRKETEKKRADNTFLIEVPKESLQKVFDGETLELEVPGGRVRFCGLSPDWQVRIAWYQLG